MSVLKIVCAHSESLVKVIVRHSSRWPTYHPLDEARPSGGCLDHGVLASWPDTSTLRGIAFPLASMKTGSRTGLLKFTVELVAAMHFLRTHRRNFIVASRQSSCIFLQNLDFLKYKDLIF